MAVQYAKAAGFQTIDVSSSNGKEEWEYKLGTDKFVYDTIGLKAAGGGADVILASSNS